MTRRGLLYGLITTIFLVVGLVIYLPASVATGWIASATPLRFDGVTGTLLHGKAAYVSLPSGGIHDVVWRIEPANLLFGRLTARVHVDTDLDGLSATVTHTLFGGNHLRDIRGDATLGWFARLGGYTFVPVSARIALAIDSLDVNENATITQINGHVDVSDARDELFNPAVPLGQFRANLSTTDHQAIQASIVDSRGPLALGGQARLTPDQRFVLAMRLRARASASERLKNLLKQLGRQDSSGWYHVNERGHL